MKITKIIKHFYWKNKQIKMFLFTFYAVAQKLYVTFILILNAFFGINIVKLPIVSLFISCT